MRKEFNDNLYERPIGHIGRRGLEKRRVDFLKKYINFVMTGRMVSDTTKIYIRSAGSSVAEAFRLHNTGLLEEQQINIKTAYAKVNYDRQKMLKIFPEDMLTDVASRKNLGVTIDENFIDEYLDTIANVNLRNDLREHINEKPKKSKGNKQETQIETRGRLPYGSKYRMTLENPLGIDFDKLTRDVYPDFKKKGIDKIGRVSGIVEEAYSLNGIVKIICINHENLYVDTSRYFVPDSWKPLRY